MRRVALVGLAVWLLGCSHVDHETRLRRVLLGTGGATLGLGLLTAGGCIDNDTGCGGGPRDASLGVGIPLLVVGAGLLTAGVLVKPPKGLTKPRLPPLLGPAQPDPFVLPIRKY